MSQDERTDSYKLREERERTRKRGEEQKIVWEVIGKDKIIGSIFKSNRSLATFKPATGKVVFPDMN